MITVLPLGRWWAEHRESSLRAAITVMAVAAVVWLSYEFWRLLWGSAPIWPTSPTGAVDLKLLHRLVHDWFAGRPVYQELASGVYPPATYVLLWPLLGSSGSSSVSLRMAAAGSWPVSCSARRSS